MDRALAYSEMLCCCTDGCHIFGYVASEDNTSLIRLYLQNTTPREIISLKYMLGGFRKYLLYMKKLRCLTGALLLFNDALLECLLALADDNAVTDSDLRLGI